jgi:hypothetical protein
MVQVNWKTDNEVNVDRFELENAGQKIATVYAGGNYHYTDRSPKADNFYRLKMIDKDGSFTYSKVVKVSFARTVEQVKVYNTVGQLIVNKKGFVEDIKNQLRPGFYLLRYAGKTEKYFKKQ